MISKDKDKKNIMPLNNIAVETIFLKWPSITRQFWSHLTLKGKLRTVSLNSGNVEQFFRNPDYLIFDVYSWVDMSVYYYLTFYHRIMVARQRFFLLKIIYNQLAVNRHIIYAILFSCLQIKLTLPLPLSICLLLLSL